ncbi:MAG TPA: ATP-binding protein [Candidatus Binatia bacterium]|nr:ATP-binding protein [Candidatus Binatia bacterium]
MDHSAPGRPPGLRSIAAALRSWRALVGATTGGLSALLSALPAAIVGDGHGFVSNLPLAAVSVVGLLFGWVAAATAFVIALGALLVLPVPGGPLADLVRLISFLIVAPIIIVLLRRLEVIRAAAVEARERVEASRLAAETERSQLEVARRETARALGRAERERLRLEEVAEAIPEPLIVYDDTHRGTYGNRAALRLFGRSFIERELDEWGRIAEPRDETGVALDRGEWPQVLAQTSAMRRRLILRIPMSGRDVIVDVEGTPIPGGGALLLLRDVGREEDARRRLSGFASFVAHELRNPLAVAKARLELAQRDPELPTRAGTHGARALDSVDAAIDILERLELYSRAEAGRVEAVREPFDLAPAVGSAIERLRTRGSEREVLVSLAPDIRVMGDQPLSVLAITNLLTNADRYSTPGAPIHVEVAPGDPVALRVRDEGPGVADEMAEQLFRDRVAAGRGLGLGLFLVRAAMDAMGGSVELEQRGPVAVFALRWPRAT